MAIKKVSSPKRSSSNAITPQRRRMNIRCFMCGSQFEKQQGNFAKVKSRFYEQNDGYLHVCNKCIDNEYQHYLATTNGDIKTTIFILCLNFNIYYSDDILEAATKSPKFDENPFGTYLSRTNLTQYSRKTEFTETADEKNLISKWTSSTPEEIIESGIVKDEKPSAEILYRWGSGYTNEEYAFMQTLYKSLMQQKRNVTPLQEGTIVDACKYKCQHNRFISQGDGKGEINPTAIKTLSVLYQDALKVLGLDVSDKNDGVDEGTFGLWIRDIEKYCPAEDYKDKKKFRDMDGLGEYVERFIFRPLKNWLTGSKDKDPEYTIGGDEVV